MTASEERGRWQFGTNRRRPLTAIIGTPRGAFGIAQRSAAFREPTASLGEAFVSRYL
jgi:hypothetical protein